MIPLSANHVADYCAKLRNVQTSGRLAAGATLVHARLPFSGVRDSNFKCACAGNDLQEVVPGMVVSDYCFALQTLTVSRTELTFLTSRRALLTLCYSRRRVEE